MPVAPTLTAMQRHVLDNLSKVVMHNRPKPQALGYELQGKDVSAQIFSLIAKDLVIKCRAGELCRREED